MGKEENTDFLCIDDDFAYGRCAEQCNECKELAKLTHNNEN